MGRYPLLTLVAIAAFACEPPPPRLTTGDPHADLACAECHQGGLADRSVASVPQTSCMRSGCHAGTVPTQVTLATVRFTHWEHGSTGPTGLECAGCHEHQAGGEPLTAGAGTCGLCHADALAGSRGEDCRLCHATPNHTGITSQGVAVPHEGLPWIEGGCLRCHYAVSLPVHEVSLSRCGQCHDDVARVTEAGIGEDLHPLHAGNACGTCHEEDNHRIEAMSSAIDLQCVSCHANEHGVDVDHAWINPSTCESCHAEVHQGPQRLLLGILPEVQAAAPSNHFMDGLTCRSCHIPSTSTDANNRPGTSEACVQCHRPEYATVLRWWNQGIRERLTLVDRYLAGAETAVRGRGADDPGVRATARARSQLELVRTSGGQHNLPLAHRIFEDALAGAETAYREAGAGVPPAPQLGRAPRQGICAYCHYRIQEPGMSDAMDDAFHREVLRNR